MKAQASPSRKTFKPTDIIIVLIAAALLALTFLLRNVSSESGAAAGVFHDGERIALLPLDKDGIYPFDEYGVTVEVKDGRVRISEADCPDKICEKTGFISSPLQTIVCLPNRISVRILNSDTDSNIDIILN